jgi:hypothetical protein
MHTADIMKKLNAADPTIVFGPNIPENNLLLSNSISESIISGADEPRAIRVKFATVSFHTFARYFFFLPVIASSIMIILSALVITSMDVINTSETIATAENAQPSKRKCITAEG